jgi:hypothetical protein
VCDKNNGRELFLPKFLAAWEPLEIWEQLEMKNKQVGILATLVAGLLNLGFQHCAAQQTGLDLKLPEVAVSRRSSVATTMLPKSKRTFARLTGPGCIKHIWASHSLPQKHSSRNSIIRIYFDDEPVPYVEAPSGDFFGVMHGKPWYPINTPFLSVQAEISFNCYFPMPFAKSARVEFEAGDESQIVFCMVDWEEFPDQQMEEKRRFCARWRREFPTERFGQNFLMFDADGPGQLVGYVFGLRLIDYTDRWSHGGADNIYIDGDGEHPSYIRGIGGEDTFATSDGGSLHPPSTHLNASMPLFEHFDDGKTRPAKNITGYRFFHNDRIHFQKSIQMRFGCMSNDICATVYWYQQGPVRPYFEMPDFSHLVPGKESKEIPRGSHDLPIPDSGSWLISEASHTDEVAVAAQTPLDPDESIDPAVWKRLNAMHGFISFLHARRPNPRGSGIYIHSGAASARSVLRAPADMTATVQLGWDDRLVLRVNDAAPIDLGHRDSFGSRTVDVPLKKGDNVIDITLSNTQNFNHGGWAFAFKATTPEGEVLVPQAPVTETEKP